MTTQDKSEKFPKNTQACNKVEIEADRESGHLGDFAGLAYANTGEQRDSELENTLSRRVRVHIFGFRLTLLTILACLFTLRWAHEFFIPVVFSILIAYTLNPVVAWLERCRVPRALGTTLLMCFVLGSTTLLGNSLLTQFQAIVDQLPDSTKKLGNAFATLRHSQSNTIKQVQNAAAAIEKATNRAAGIEPISAKPASSSAGAASASTSVLQLKEWLWAGSLGALGLISQATIVLFLVFFLLLSGDMFKRKLVKLTGPSLTSKKMTVNILTDINSSIQRYMSMLLVTNGLLALLMWIGLSVIGLENAGAWSVAAGLLHIIPYFGPLFISVALGLAAFLQFGTFSMLLLVAGLALVVATTVGTFITTWMTGKIARMNATAVFIGLLLWGWLWGIWGLLLGIPIIVVIKVVAERIEGMQTLAELLGE